MIRWIVSTETELSLRTRPPPRFRSSNIPIAHIIVVERRKWFDCLIFTFLSNFHLYICICYEEHYTPIWWQSYIRSGLAYVSPEKVLADGLFKNHRKRTVKSERYKKREYTLLNAFASISTEQILEIFMLFLICNAPLNLPFKLHSKSSDLLNWPFPEVQTPFVFISFWLRSVLQISGICLLSQIVIVSIKLKFYFYCEFHTALCSFHFLLSLWFHFPSWSLHSAPSWFICISLYCEYLLLLASFYFGYLVVARCSTCWFEVDFSGKWKKERPRSVSGATVSPTKLCWLLGQWMGGHIALGFVSKKVSVVRACNFPISFCGWSKNFYTF